MAEFVDIYLASLDTQADTLERLARLLAPDERERGARFAYPELTKRFVAAHGVLRLILSEHTSVAPREIAFLSQQRGKPVIDPALGAVDRHFNLSHSGGLLCVAVSSLGPIGVDVELPRLIDDASQLLRSILTTDELQTVRQVLDDGETSASETVLRFWTAKEAVMKATGHGLYVNPREVRVAQQGLRPFLEGHTAALTVSCPVSETARGEDTWDEEQWEVRPFRTEEAFGAVAIAPAAVACELQFHRLTEDDIRNRLTRLEGGELSPEEY